MRFIGLKYPGDKRHGGAVAVETEERFALPADDRSNRMVKAWRAEQEQAAKRKDRHENRVLPADTGAVPTGHRPQVSGGATT